MKRNISIWVLLLVASLGAGAQQSANYLSFRNVAELQRFLSYSPTRVPLVSAHRGGPAKGFPENAIETFNNSLNSQPLIVECDIALSKDSVLMMMHDNTLDRTTTGKGKVEDYTWEQLQQLYLKDNEGNVTAFRIPSLDAVLNWGKGKVIYTLDVKRGVPFARVIDAVRRAKAEAASVVITYNADQAAEVHRLAPDLMLSVTIRNAQELQRLNDKGIPDEKMVAFVGVSQPDSSLYTLLHSRKIQCILGTMGNLDRQAAARGDKMYAEYISNGADILSTDRPEEAGAALKQYREDNKLALPGGRPAGRTRPRIDTTQHITPGRSNSRKQEKKPYVILISADGFRHDYMEQYKATHLAALSQKGVQAVSMRPAFPTVTFPNHYTLATGLYPAHHGLVNNSFYDPVLKDRYSMSDKEKVADPKWYGGVPLWVLAEQQQMVAANLFWVGSEAPVENTPATYYYDFDDNMEVAKRIKIVKDWLLLPEEKRPHFITFYLSDVDHAGHTYGPESKQVQEAVVRVDSIVQALNDAIQATGLPVNFIFVSDHGMTAVDREHPLPMPVAIDTAKFIIPSSGTMMVLHAKDAKDILPTYNALKKQEEHFKVYLKKDMPAAWHYSTADDKLGRIGDILLVPDWPYVFSSRKPGAGYHGFPPEVKDMEATFLAWGPNFRQGIRVPTFDNVHVYPLVAEILGLKITEPIDGRISVLKKTLRK